MAFVLFALIFAGCDSSRNSTENEEPVDEMPQGNLQVAEEECASLRPGQFCITGLDFLKVGDSLLWNSKAVPTLEALSVKDTIFEDYIIHGSTTDTVAWYVRRIRYADGDVFLEQDFENPHLMGRVRIESAQYSHPSGLRVGSTVKDIKSNFREIIPRPFPEYDVMELIVAYSEKRMVFHVPLGSYYSASREEYEIDDIPEDSRVTRIVLM